MKINLPIRTSIYGADYPTSRSSLISSIFAIWWNYSRHFAPAKYRRWFPTITISFTEHSIQLLMRINQRIWENNAGNRSPQCPLWYVYSTFHHQDHVQFNIRGTTKRATDKRKVRNGKRRAGDPLLQHNGDVPNIIRRQRWGELLQSARVQETTAISVRMYY